MIVNCNGFIFSAAHYLPMHIRQRCRLLHGHTFTVDFAAEGEICADGGMVVFYSDVQHRLIQILDPMDHKVILPNNSTEIINEFAHFFLPTEKGLEKCILPLSTVYLLDKPFATIEFIAEHIVDNIWSGLIKDYSQLFRVSLTVSENVHYSAIVSRQRL